MSRLLLIGLFGMLLVGCGVSSSDPPPLPTSAEAVAEARKLLVASEPPSPQSVIEVRQKGKHGDAVVVIGQIGGETKPFIEGRASFLLVDSSLKPTLECDCPWDFCEYRKADLAAARVSVKFVDALGKTLPVDAREAFGVKELSKVIVSGKVQRDDNNNVVIVGTGLFVRPEAKP